MKSFCSKIYTCTTAVAPFVGAWIEISPLLEYPLFAPSLPSWERGLKYAHGGTAFAEEQSLPSWERGLKSKGLPLGFYISQSLPSWERGLKFTYFRLHPLPEAVAPFVGAWIEIFSRNSLSVIRDRRSLRGSVD